MCRFAVNFLFIYYLYLKTCDCSELSLKIIKSTGDFFTPISTQLVEEKAGANFSLLCDLVSSETNSNYYDFQISWIKQEKEKNDLRFWRFHDSDNKTSRKMYSVLTPSEMNKAVKHFRPLRASDAGKYFCISLKYNLLEVVEIVVRDEQPSADDSPNRRIVQETMRFCSEQMFQCVNGFCIIHHYVCDGQADCKDGSDESEETCQGNPCKDKLMCDDGRCIPTNWCCDRHHDPNCTVTNRPKCCQLLSETYEELENPSTTISNSSQGARYILISVCTLCILIVILLFLVLAGRVMLMAQKSDLIRTNGRIRPPQTIETINLGDQSTTIFRHNFYPRQNIDLIGSDACEDPLLFARNEEQPPPYREVVALPLEEPPPPYTSMEILNQSSERN